MPKVCHCSGFAEVEKPILTLSADSPLTGSCSVNEQRDCGNGKCICECIALYNVLLSWFKHTFALVTAIANYPTRVVDTRLPKEQVLEALLFLGTFFSL